MPGKRGVAILLAAAGLFVAGGCSLAGSARTVDGVPHVDALAITSAAGAAGAPAGTTGTAPSSSAAASAASGSTAPRSSHPASTHRAISRGRTGGGAASAPGTTAGSTRAPAPPAPATSPAVRLQTNPSGPRGVPGDGGIVAAINSYRAGAGLAAVSGTFWQPAQNCAIKNLPTFTGHCLPSGMAGEVYAGMYSQSGSTAAGLWYGEGPGGEHYRIMMSRNVTRAYYGWAYDPRSGFYDVIVDFYTDGHSGI